MIEISIEELKRISFLLRDKVATSLYAYALGEQIVYEVDIVGKEEATLTPAYRIEENELIEIEGGETHTAEFMDMGRELGCLVDSIDGTVAHLLKV